MGEASSAWVSPLLDLLFEDPHVGRCLIAPDGHVLRANREWLRSTGFELDDVLGADIVDLFPETRDMALALHARARAGHHVDASRRAQRIQGRETWWEEGIAPVPMAGGTGLLITAREVPPQTGSAAADGGRRGADEVPQRQWERDWLASFPERNPNPIVEIDPEGNLSYLNPAARDLLPDLQEKGVGHPWLAGMDQVARDLKESPRRSLTRVVKVGEIQYQQVMFYVRESNRLRIYGLDVTEQKWLEDELRKSEERLRLFIEHTPAAVAMFDRQMRYLAASGRFVSSYRLGTQDLVGRSHYEVFPEIPDRWKEIHRRCLAGAVEKCEEDPFPRADGTMDWIRWEILPWRDSAGEIGGILMFTEVVTERKLAEQRLLQSEQEFRALADSIPQLAWTARADGHVTWYNRRWYEYTGTTLEQMEGWGWQAVPDPAILPEVLRRWKESIATGTAFDMELPLRGTDGKFRRFLTRVLPLKDSSRNVTRWFGTSTDVTEFVEAQQALRESEERLRAAFAASPDAISINRLRDGACVLVNEGFGRLSGWSPEEVVGKTAPGLNIWVDWEEGRRILERLLAGEPVQEAEMTFRRRDGTVFTGSLSAQTFTANGERFLLAITRDISDQKRAEKALHEAARRKDEFLAILSHELRNPLAPIRNSIYMLDRASPGSPQAARAKEVINRQTEHLTRLIDDLLDVTRISRGKIELGRTRLDVREILSRTCDDHRTLFGGRGIELRLEMISGPVWIEADETRIAQVVGNLLQNAAKFSHERGAVTVSVGTAEGQAQIRVHDEGIGISPDLLPRLFEPFVQAEGGLARTKGGLGLGLALVKGLVELHGGTVSARSEGLGAGSELVVTLPLAPAPEQIAPVLPPSTPVRAIEILVIEDNVDAARSIAEVLEMEGHRVHVATDGRSGIAKALELEPEVILCDIGLPDVDGYEIARELRGHDALRTTRLIALSGYAQPEDRRRGKEAGFDDHIAKPPSLTALLALVASGTGES